MDPPASNEAPQEPRKVVIIGSGITGLALLLALEKIKSIANISPVLYTKDTRQDFENQKQKYCVLWKSGIEACLELGIAKRIGKVSWPNVSIKSFELADPAPSTTTTTTTTTSNNTNTNSGDNAGLQNLVSLDWSVSTSPTQSSVPMDTDYLPPMVGLLKQDLVRTLLVALSGRQDLVSDSAFAIKSPNNGDSVQETTLPTGMEADLATGPDWFSREGFEALLPQIKFGHELESFIISAEYGTTYLKFSNGVREKAFMLMGCDGPQSTIRNLLFNDRSNLQHTHQLVIEGITSTLAPPIDSPTHRSADGLAINHLTHQNLVSFFKQEQSSSWWARNLSIGVTSLGNDLLGWTLIAPQATPGLLAEQFTMPKRRQELGMKLGGSFPMLKGPSGGGGGLRGKIDHKRDPSNASGTNWKVPSDSDFRTSTVEVESEDTQNSIVGTRDSVAVAESGSLYPNPDSQPQIDSTSSFHPGSQALPPMPEENPNYHSRNSLLDKFGTDNLTGQEARDLALHLTSQVPTLPPQVIALISQCKSNNTVAYDNSDICGSDHYLKSYTSLTFHPGRVMVVGDAAHPMATTPHSSHTISTSLCDVVVLAKLVAKYLSTPESIHNPNEAIEKIGKEYSSVREAVGTRVMHQVHDEAQHLKKDASFLGMLYKLASTSSSSTPPPSWTRATDLFDMADRGKMNLDASVPWPRLS